MSPNFFLDTKSQQKHYKDLIRSRRKSKGLSCGYYERFDPFIFSKRPELVSIYSKLFDKIIPDKIESCLDIACGTLFYWPVLSGRVKNLYGVDLSADMLKEVMKLIEERRLQASACRADALQLPFADNCLEFVLSIDTLHHIEDLWKYFQEVKRVLKPGGRIVCVEPNMLNPMMFLGHLLPSEERMGILRNYSWKISKQLQHYFGDTQTLYWNLVTGTASPHIALFIKMLEKVSKKIPIAATFSFRFLLLGKKLS